MPIFALEGSSPDAKLRRMRTRPGSLNEGRRDFRREPRPLALVHLRPLLHLVLCFEREHADPAGRIACSAEPLHVLELAERELAYPAAQAGFLVGLPFESQLVTSMTSTPPASSRRNGNAATCSR